jgi:hypothetical protein
MNMRMRTAMANNKTGPVNGVQFPQVESVQDAVDNLPEAVLVKAINDQIASWALNWARGEKSVLAEGKLLTYTPSATGGSNVDANSILAKLKA